MDFSLRSGTSRVFASGAVLGVAWLFYSQMISPLRLREKDSISQIGELRERIDAARKTIHEIKDSEQESAQARATLNRQLGECSEGLAIVSYPESLKKHFAEVGLPLRVVRLNTIREEPGLRDYRRAYWSVGLAIPETERAVAELLAAVVELSDRNRFSKIVDFVLQPDAEDPKLRSASVNIEVLLRK